MDMRQLPITCARSSQPARHRRSTATSCPCACHRSSRAAAADDDADDKCDDEDDERGGRWCCQRFTCSPGSATRSKSSASGRHANNGPGEVEGKEEEEEEYGAAVPASPSLLPLAPLVSPGVPALAEATADAPRG